MSLLRYCREKYSLIPPDLVGAPGDSDALMRDKRFCLDGLMRRRVTKMVGTFRFLVPFHLQRGGLVNIFPARQSLMR
jgi:hypothetical protein